MKTYEDLTGQKFGRLTVIKRAEDHIYPSGKRRIKWSCMCECGNKNEVIVKANDLKNGKTKSCGCLNNETRRINAKKNKKYNTYDLTGEYGIGYTSKGEEFYFDLEDYDKIKDYCWCKKSDGYMHSKINGKLIVMHRFLFPDYEFIDHINHKKHDNRKFNLREVTKSQNSMNKNTLKSSSSGISGVTWNKNNNNWRVRIGVNGNRIDIGSFSNYEDAVKARKEAEEKYFGEFSYDNSMKLSNF